MLRVDGDGALDDVLADAMCDPHELGSPGAEGRASVWRSRARGRPGLVAGQVPPAAPVAAAVQEVGDRLVVVEHAFEMQQHPEGPCSLGLGSYALVPLAEAREKALANRKLARAGGNPRAGRRRGECVFRRKWNTDFGRSGTSISEEVEHRFREVEHGFRDVERPFRGKWNTGSGVVNARR